MNVSLQPSKDPHGASLSFDVAFDPASLTISPTPFGVTLTLDECVMQGEPGGPSLPSRMLRVALPIGTTPSDVVVRDVRTTSLGEGPMFPAPLQPARPGSRSDPKARPPCNLPPGDSTRDKPDATRLDRILENLRAERVAAPIPAPEYIAPREDLYAKAVESPAPFARLVGAERRGANPIALIEINPVRLDRKGSLELVTQATVEVRWTAARENGDALSHLVARPILSRAQADRTTELVRSIVINPDAVIDLGRIIAPVVLDVDYLIITDNFRWDAAAITRLGAVSGDMVAHFTRLAEWKRLRGLRTRVTTITDIVNGAYGDFRSGARDLQEVLRRFLQHAHTRWGVAWVLLGGDISVVPARQVVGYADGWIASTTTNPPGMHQAFWTGTFMRMRTSGRTAASPLLNADNGLTIPHDAAGTSSPTQRGWFFTTNDTYTTRSATPTEFIRINGPAAEVNGRLLWVAEANTIPTDFYYASLVGPNYGVAGRSDWDLSNNGIYGTHTDDTDIDGVEYEADVSVGRAPVESAAEAGAWIDKVIAYEKFRRPDGTLLSDTWTRKMIIGAANWGGRIAAWMTTSNPPGDNQAYRAPGATRTLIHTADMLSVNDWRLLVQVSPTDIRVSPFNATASPTSRGWRFARSATDLSASEFVINVLGIVLRFPIPTAWIVVFGPVEELAPQVYLFDHTTADGSMSDQEQLRLQIGADLPAVNQIHRLYEDDIDLTPAQRAAAPIENLTEDRMLARINDGPHFVSLSGHGWWGGCCGYGLNAAENATNGLHAYIAYADSCSTNQFDVNDAVSERSLQNPNGGAVAYVGNSRYSWIGVGDNFQRAFFRRFKTTRHLGLAADTRCAMVNEATGFWRRYNKWAIFTLNLMGDPEMPVWIGPPRRLIPHHARELDTRQPFEVRVTTRSILGIELPVAGAVVTVRQGTFLRQATTNASGRVSLNISAAQLGTMDLTITRTGYLPVIDTVEVVGPAWVRGIVDLVSHQHSAPDHTYVRLALAAPIEGASRRSWYARRTLADYGVILDAVTDAYISQKEISLFVASIKAGGTIERFRFGSPFLQVRPELTLADQLEHAPVLVAAPAQQAVITELESVPTSNGATVATPAEPEPTEIVASAEGEAATNRLIGPGVRSRAERQTASAPLPILPEVIK